MDQQSDDMSNEKKHTPGPWQFRVYQSGCTIISTQPQFPGSMVMDRLKGVTVDVHALIDDDQSNASEASPDARLIAAAPCLLEALKYARRFLNEQDHDTAYIDGIITKATGAAK